MLLLSCELPFTSAEPHFIFSRCNVLIIRYHVPDVLDKNELLYKDGKRDMFFSILLGALSGIVGFLPLIWGLRLAHKATPTSNLGHAGALLLGVLLSFLILAATMILCLIIARDMAFSFVLAEGAGLVCTAAAYGVYKLVRK